MKINKNPKPKTEMTSTKQKLWDEFQRQPDAVLALAYMYAKGYDLSGEDITKAWTNAITNNQLIEQVYRKGYEDALKDIEEQKRRDFYHKAIVDVKVKGDK